MAGVRLHHPTFFSCTFVVELPTQMPEPDLCPSCLKVHENKSIHLRLDSNGDVIVSPEVYEKLLAVFLAGFEVVNEVEKPPPLFMGAVDQGKFKTVEHRLNGHKQSPDFWAPAKTKYESEKLSLKPFEPLISAWTAYADWREWDKKHKKGLKFFDMKPKKEK